MKAIGDLLSFEYVGPSVSFSNSSGGISSSHTMQRWMSLPAVTVMSYRTTSSLNCKILMTYLMHSWQGLRPRKRWIYPQMFPHPEPYIFTHSTSLQPNLQLNLRPWNVENFNLGIFFLSLKNPQDILSFEVEITKFPSVIFPTPTKSSHSLSSPERKQSLRLSSLIPTLNK